MSTKKITRGSRFEQVALVVVDGEEGARHREITIIAPATPSSPAAYRITRNDSHPHRVGKVASIRRADLDRKYRRVS